MGNLSSGALGVSMMAMRVVEFSNGGYKKQKESTYPKKIIEFGVFSSTVRCRKVPKYDFQSQFSKSKIIRIFLIF